MLIVGDKKKIWFQMLIIHQDPQMLIAFKYLDIRIFHEIIKTIIKIPKLNQTTLG